jgi:ferredoxin
MLSYLLILFVFAILLSTSIAYYPGTSSLHSSKTKLYGLGDMLKKALANDPSLPPQKNPGLSKDPDIVSVEFLPSKKVVKAILGQSLRQIADSAGVEIRYKCKKGECNTCAVNFNGKIVKACQSSLPITSTLNKFTVGIPSK